MTTITFFLAGKAEHFSDKRLKFPEIERQICLDQGLSYSEIFDLPLTLKLSNGRVGPGGFVMQARDGEVLYNYFDLVNWIEKNGFRRC